MASGTLVDGHNRFEICERLGIAYRTVELDLPDRDAAIVWIIDNQLGRRNLPDFVACELAKARQEHLPGRPNGSNQHTEGCSTLDNPPPNPTDRFGKSAEAAGVSRGTYAKAATIIEAAKAGTVAPETMAALRSGETSINAVYTDLKSPKPHVTRNSGDNEWYTPAAYIEAARAVMGKIVLDPASSPEANAVVKAEYIYTAQEDGLAQDWCGPLWMNPPYASDLVGKFADKLAESVGSGAVTDAVVLVNNATETRWFAQIASVASCLCFPTGRVKFWHPSKEATPLQGQAILYVGKNRKRFAAEFQQFGIVAEIVR